MHLGGMHFEDFDLPARCRLQCVFVCVCGGLFVPRAHWDAAAEIQYSIYTVEVDLKIEREGNPRA